MYSNRKILSAACGVAFLAAAPAAASTLPPTASLFTNGSLSLNAQTGFTLSGSLTAEYRQPTGPAKPYIFSTSASINSLSFQPDITLITPAFTIPVPIFPDISIPSFNAPLSFPIPLPAPGTIYDASVTSPPLPLGGIFGFDFGSPLLGTPLTFGTLVQNQFETGATVVAVSGAVGPFDWLFDYTGILQPGNEVIEAVYSLSIGGSGLLAELEALALGLLNENKDALIDLAIEGFLASDPCSTVFGLTGGGLALCRPALPGLVNPLADQFDLTVDGFGTFSAGYSASKTITPVPVPAALPLLAGGIAVFGLMGLRRRRRAA